MGALSYNYSKTFLFLLKYMYIDLSFEILRIPTMASM